MPSESSPWLTAWFSPGETIKEVLKKSPWHDVYPIGIYGFIPIGIVNGLYLMIGSANARHWGDKDEMWVVYMKIILLAIPIGLLTLWGRGLLIALIGKIFNGKAALRETIAVITSSNLSFIFPVILYLFLLIGGGESFVTSENTIPQHSLLLLKLISVLANAASLLAEIWSLVFMTIGLAQINRFSVWKAALISISWFVLTFLWIHFVSRSHPVD